MRGGRYDQLGDSALINDFVMMETGA